MTPSSASSAGARRRYGCAVDWFLAVVAGSYVQCNELLATYAQNAIARAGSDGGGSEARSPPGEALGRGDNLDATLWSKGVFESTPYGYFHKMMSSTSSTGGARTAASRVKLDHDTIEFGPEAVRREMPRGKRTDFGRHGVDVRRASIELS